MKGEKMTNNADTFTERDATVLFEVENGRIKRVDICMVPPPNTCYCTGEFPGLAAAVEGR